MSLLLPNDILIMRCQKTGSTWIRKALQNAGIPFTAPYGQHVPLKPEMRKWHRYIIGFVRHPLGWYHSYWRNKEFHRLESGSDVWKHEAQQIFPKVLNEECASPSYPQFLRNVLDRCPGFFSSYVMRFVECEDGPVNYLGRTESLTIDLIQALRSAGMDVDEAAIWTTLPDHVTGHPPGELPDASLRQAILDTEPIVGRYYGF